MIEGKESEMPDSYWSPSPKDTNYADSADQTADPFDYGISESQTAVRIIENLANERGELRKQVHAGREQIKAPSHRLAEMTDQLRKLVDS